MDIDNNALLNDFIHRLQLPEVYTDTARDWFLPLADEFAKAVTQGQLQVLGIVGCQGSGKSTLAALLELVLSQQYQLKVAVLSLDDFYLSRKERQDLAAKVHPLLRTRGVPGTHDIHLALKTIDALLSEKMPVHIPRFDKARDDRRAESEWDVFPAPADLVILEGWCLAARPQSEVDLAAPINELEANEDPDGRWRRYANQQLTEVYPTLFQRIDKLIALIPPGFDCVYHWRRQQERQLPVDAGAAIMGDQALHRFVQHFERITRYNLPYQAQADIVFYLDKTQRVVKREDNTHGAG